MSLTFCQKYFIFIHVHLFLSSGTKKMEYKTRQWHEKCFSCVVCKSAIGTKSFIPRDQEVYCATCYEEKFSTRCVKCDKVLCDTITNYIGAKISLYYKVLAQKFIFFSQIYYDQTIIYFDCISQKPSHNKV